ncbi:MAG: hypothetical protein PUF66_00090 [Clostridium sp.]|jgi:hypothetical protein|nr:hypothetical protein [Clostridium sp.]CDE74238.1 unknown [Clostridium sp. CAG:451]
MNVKDKILFLKKRLRRRTLFFLILTLMANTFAWFIYSNKVSNNITTGVKSWKINFKQDGVDIVNNVEFKIDSIYPGMPDYTNSLSITNIGETAANISYEVEEIKILDEFYNSDMYSSTDLINRLKDNYPFKMNFSINNQEVGTGQTSEFTFSLVWPYESGHDEADTYWGKKSASFKEQYPDKEQIAIKVKIIAGQKES